MLAKKRSPKYTRADFPPTHAVLDADFKLFAKHTHNKRRLKVISTNGTVYRTMREAKLVFSLRAQLAEAQVSVVDLKDATVYGGVWWCMVACGGVWWRVVVYSGV